jgi:hypothetical protein
MITENSNTDILENEPGVSPYLRVKLEEEEQRLRRPTHNEPGVSPNLRLLLEEERRLRRPLTPEEQDHLTGRRPGADHNPTESAP